MTESILGAVYRDGGYGKAFRLVQKLYEGRLDNVKLQDAKTELQELLHALGQDAPRYELEKTEGPEHAPTFLSSVHLRGRTLGRGVGNTKKASQQEAAREALAELKKESFHALKNDEEAGS